MAYKTYPKGKEPKMVKKFAEGGVVDDDIDRTLKGDAERPRYKVGTRYGDRALIGGRAMAGDNEDDYLQNRLRRVDPDEDTLWTGETVRRKRGK